MSDVQVRVLTGDDAAIFHPVRIQAVQEHPEAFGTSVEEEESRSLEVVASRMGDGQHSFTLGAFLDDELVGIVYIVRQNRPKMRHRMHINAMYVVPEARGRKIGRALIEAAINQARRCDGVEDIVLAVTYGNKPAKSLYESYGFTVWGRDPRYLKIDGEYFDIEWMILSLSENV